MTRIAIIATLVLPFVLCGCAEDPILKLSDDLEELDLNTRLAAVRTLRDLDDDRAIELLAEALESDEDLVDAAGNALAHKGRALTTDDKPDKVNEALTRIMNNTHLEQPPRAKAAWALGEIGDRESIPSLKSTRSAKDAKGVAVADVRTQAVQALQKIGFYTKGRASALDANGEVLDVALDGTPALEQPTAPTGVPPAEEEEEEAEAAEEETAPEEEAMEEATEEATEEVEPSEAPAPESTEAETEPEPVGTEEDASPEETAPAEGTAEPT